ncbi:MAG: class I SAM-dependent methyltransferase [Candidatus Omnitrophica bacterium]|nr:class I SAM-dependent methyltransferase [Candidatus Omnitrophota bacterium]
MGYIENIVWYLYERVYEVILNKLLPRQLMLENVLEILKVSAKGKYLDAGCGLGDFSFRIKERGGEVIGIDRSRYFLEKAKKKYSNINFMYGDLEKELYFLNNEEFDGVVSINTLYLIKNYKYISGYKVPLPLLEFRRVLKNKGVVVVVTPRCPGYSQIAIFKEHLKLSFQRLGKFITIFQLFFYFPYILIVVLANFYVVIKGKKGDYKFYRDEELKRFLELCGFKNIRINSCYANQNILAVAEK